MHRWNPWRYSGRLLACLCNANVSIVTDLEWKLTYVGSAESAAHDQVLDTVVVGPVPVGKHKFIFQADNPDPEKIPVADAIGVTAVLLTCSYKDHEFVRVGYFVNNDYTDPELRDNPPAVPQYDKVTSIAHMKRLILVMTLQIRFH